VQIDNATSKFELTLYAIEREDGLAAYLEYNTDLFDPATSAASSATWPPSPGRAGRPRAAALRAFLVLARGGAPAAPRLERYHRRISPRPLLHDLITLQVARTPGAVAVELEGERVTYQDLDGQANRLARHLRRLGVGPEVLVGLGSSARST